MSDYDPLVKKGAALLDQVDPDWWKKIDLWTLNMASFAHCVLGQLYGDLFKGCSVLIPQANLNLDEYEGVFVLSYGFATEGSFHDGVLTKFWQQAILERMPCR